MKWNKYKISFKYSKYNEGLNWVAVSSITKEDLNGFIEYLCSLNRDIEVLPFIPGGLIGFRVKADKDETKSVIQIAKDIKNKVDKDKMLNHHFPGDLYEEQFSTMHFIEDEYEFYISLGINKEIALEAIGYDEARIKQFLMVGELKNNSKLKALAHRRSVWIQYPKYSRYVFVYMFRKEFLKYMSSKGYDVEIDGGWVLNDKKREIELGLIDINGNLLR